MKQKASENKLLLYFLKDKRDSATREKIRDLIALHLDWNYIIKITSSHGAGPMFYHYLEQINILPLIPLPIQQTIKLAYYQNAYKNFHRYKQLSEILSILQREGFTVMLIKGAILAQVIYKNIALRPMGDIDIMVRRKEDEKKIRALTSRVNHSLTLEINYRPNDIIPKDWPEKKGTDIIEKVWERAIPVEIAKIKVWMPCPEDFLLFLILNLSRKGNYYMRYLFDLLNFFQLHAQNINWESFINNLYSCGLQKQSWFLFDFLHSVLKISVPGQDLVLRNTPYLSLGEKIIWNMYKRDFLTDHIPVPFLKKTMTGHFQFPTIFPPKEALAEIYHQSTNSRYIYLYYFIRLYEKSSKYSRFALKFLYLLARK